MNDPVSLVEWENECGVVWVDGEPARHHICVRKGRHEVCRCLCGIEKEKEVKGDAVQ